MSHRLERVSIDRENDITGADLFAPSHGRVGEHLGDHDGETVLVSTKDGHAKLLNVVLVEVNLESEEGQQKSYMKSMIFIPNDSPV